MFISFELLGIDVLMYQAIPSQRRKIHILSLTEFRKTPLFFDESQEY